LSADETATFMDRGSLQRISAATPGIAPGTKVISKQLISFQQLNS
jgi:hypothetical protein